MVPIILALCSLDVPPGHNKKNNGSMLYRYVLFHRKYADGSLGHTGQNEMIWEMTINVSSSTI